MKVVIFTLCKGKNNELQLIISDIFNSLLIPDN